MPSWSLYFSTKAEKDLAKLDPDTRETILKAIDLLLEQPPQGDLKKLKGDEGLWRIRVGNWRIIYSRNKMTQAFVIARILRRTSTTY